MEIETWKRNLFPYLVSKTYNFSQKSKSTHYSNLNDFFLKYSLKKKYKVFEIEFFEREFS